MTQHPQDRPSPDDGRQRPQQHDDTGTQRPEAKGPPGADSAPRVVDEPDAAERVAARAPAISTGAVAGAVAGIASGLAAGPLGSLVGAAAGALGGAALGAAGVVKREDLEPHLQWWREHHAQRRPALQADYDRYEAAYRYGTEQYLLSERPRAWDEVEEALQLGWEPQRGESTLDWEAARPAVRDAWERLYDPAAFERGGG
jgi:hypothetical protein